MIVVDASVLAPALGDDGDDAQRARAHLVGSLVAPELIDIEVMSVWRRDARAGRITEQRAQQAMAALAKVSVARAPHGPLVARIWELRHNLSAYDAAYVALAEVLDAPLLTADQRLSRASQIRCQITLVR
jgi:predicted nucleic acid-binding protein